MKCLLVDDEPGIREGLAMLLRRRGYEVVTAADCASASAALSGQEFDVVVTDWRLPDGTAATFAVDCSCPVLAVSGHPEEVTRAGAIRDAIAKPVRPNVLLDQIAGLLAKDEEPLRLSRDVQVVVDDLLQQLPAESDVTCQDDGTFVVVRASVPGGSAPEARPRAGDARVVATPFGAELEVRICRDGRPDPNLPVAAIDGDWPQAEVFALDCQQTGADAETFSRWCATVAEHNASGGRICLLNVPERLEMTAATWGIGQEMPMRRAVGPCQSAELAELWR